MPYGGIHYRLQARKSGATAMECRLIFDIEDVEEWVMVEKQYMWEDVLVPY